jgi:SAM-dependent methyltransferase
MGQAPQIRFEDGATYEQMMGKWSRIAGTTFLDWLAPRPGLTWVDVGCGNGAFTELLAERCAPKDVQGIDPSEPQLKFARGRSTSEIATFQQGDAMALPFANDSFDAAVMALVIFFVPTPAQGVAEMVRVVKPGGSVSAYAWNMAGGGFPLEPILAELDAMGIARVLPPSTDASRLEMMRELWAGAGLEAIETRDIIAHRTFTDFNEFWTVSMHSGSLRQTIGKLPPGELELLKSRVSAKLPSASDGRFTHVARANAIKGRVPQ